MRFQGETSVFKFNRRSAGTGPKIRTSNHRHFSGLSLPFGVKIDLQKLQIARYEYKFKVPVWPDLTQHSLPLSFNSNGVTICSCTK